MRIFTVPATRGPLVCTANGGVGGEAEDPRTFIQSCGAHVTAGKLFGLLLSGRRELFFHRPADAQAASLAVRCPVLRTSMTPGRRRNGRDQGHVHLADRWAADPRA
jgi:hypothetical protein